jgi:hypothetical protein
MRRALFLLLGLAACSTKPPPAPAGIDASVAPLPPPRAVTSASTNDDAAAPVASANAAPVDAGAPAMTTAVGDEAGKLPQTKDKPPASSPALDARAATLWDAIVHDDPDRAMPFFFPVTAYAQVKDVSNPASDWRSRLVSAYKRDIHGLAKRLGKNADAAKLLRIEVQDERAKWVEPQEEWNKIGYYRVYGTKLVYDVDGKERSFEISSLISWRGEWFVVHLTGFK